MHFYFKSFNKSILNHIYCAVYFIHISGLEQSVLYDYSFAAMFTHLSPIESICSGNLKILDCLNLKAVD